jgi:hypothetical protein
MWIALAWLVGGFVVACLTGAFLHWSARTDSVQTVRPEPSDAAAARRLRPRFVVALGGALLGFVASSSGAQVPERGLQVLAGLAESAEAAPPSGTTHQP